MKAQILKIAGVKNEAEFYKKFPTEEAFMKKHGKELQKAADGANVSGKTDAELKAIAKQKRKDNANSALGLLANSTGSLIGLGQTIADKYGRQTDELNNYTKFSEMIAGMPKPAMVKTKYVRPEYSQVSDPQKYGVPMAEDGASVGGNPTEIQNTYDPYDIYAGLAYEPLNDSNPKQFAFGGDLANSPVSAAGGGATGGFDASKFMGAAGSLGGALGSLAGGDDFAETEESKLASTLGGAAGTAIGGPVGGLIGSAVFGGAAGFIAGKKNKQMKFQKQTLSNNLAAGSFTNVLQNGPLSSYAKYGTSIPSYEEGGYMNPEYNPQVITKFGDYDVSQLLAPPKDADMLRSGGHLAQVHYTPPSAAAMYTGRDLPYQMENGGQMAMGGDLQTVWGGKAETVSYNPYLPGTGETVLFKGQSHDDTNGRGQSGIGIKYGDGGMTDRGADVEVEKYETGKQLINPNTGEMELNISGALPINEFAAKHIGDPKSKGMLYKNYDIYQTKQEAKQNEILEKVADQLISFKPKSSTDTLKMNRLMLQEKGAKMKLKNIADQRVAAAEVQNATLDTAKEFGIDSQALAKGKIKYEKATNQNAEFGAQLEEFGKGGKKGKKKAAVVTTPPQLNLNNLGGLAKLYQAAVSTKDPMAVGKFQRAALNTLGADEIKKITGAKDTKKFVDGLFGKGTNALGKAISQKAQQMVLPQALPDPNTALQYPAGEGEVQPTMIPEWMPNQGAFTPGMSDKEVAARKAAAEAEAKASGKKQNKFAKSLLYGLNSMVQYLRPTNQLPLDPSQLSGEMLAMATNQQEPVYAQTFQPNLAQPFSVSLQDQRNQITSEARNAYRLAQYNPAQAAQIAAQAYEAKNKVGAEENRVNQAEQARVAELNRATLNDAQIKNLGIYDQQYQRTAQAKSNTKLQAIAALNSISDKIAKNKLENRQLGIAENTYNYRYTPNGVAYNMNPLQFWNMSGNSETEDGVNVPEGYEVDDYKKTPTGQFIPKTMKLKTKKSKSDDDEDLSYGRNGAIVKAIKRL